MIRTLTTLTLLCFVSFGPPARARGVDDIAGRVVGTVLDGIQIDLPMLDSDYEVSIAGDIATVTLTQEFINPSDRPMTAEYLFPLNKGAAVYAMQMHVGDEVVEAVMQEKEKAVATFQKAKREGKAAALLTQHRPNMFTQKLANLMPGLPVKVVLSYVQDVPKIDGAHELVLPLIVGPRYKGLPEADAPALNEVAALGDDDLMPAPAGGAVQADGWTIAPVPDYPLVAGLDLPDEIAADRVSLKVGITAGVPVSRVGSATHALDTEKDGDGIRATLSAGRTIDNRDFVLRYELGDGGVAAGLLSHHDERGGFFSMMITPPKIPDESMATPREMVFVLDTSGSMNGAPMRASKKFMDAALAALRPDDHFRILSFANSTAQYAASATPATPSNIRAGRSYVARQKAGGGTEMNKAINAAFDIPQPADALRIVVFLSDGYIGGEAQVLRTIRKRIGKARIYAFGVGTGVNRYLLDGIAEEGRGYARYVDPTEDAGDVAETLARDLKTPLLTDIEIDWGGLEVADVGPERLPDLFAGNTLRVFGRYAGGGAHTVTVKGLVQGRPASLPVTLNLPGADDAGDARTGAIPLIWARKRIADLERAFAVRAGDPAALKQDIIDLGLKFSLQTRYTSFVAVSKRVVNERPGEAVKRSVPLPRVAGVENTAYPRQSFAGGSAPEPGALLSLTLVAILGGLLFRRRRV